MIEFNYPIDNISIIMDRITGLVYGAMYGDALGAPHEFRRDTIDPSELIMKPLRRFNRYTKSWSQTVVGQFTDDTEMAMTLLNHLITHDWQYDPQDVVMDYLQWANSGTKFIGRNTRELLKGIGTYRGYQTRYRKKFIDANVRESALSNGALMRCYPFAIYGLFHDDFLKVAETDCRLTNPSSQAVAVEQRYLTSLVIALKGGSKQEIIGDYDLSQTVDVTVNKGLCTHALYCTYYGLTHFDSYDQAIKGIILLGGDTDTNAEIAGGLLGAFYGFQKMSQSQEFVDNLATIMRRPIEDGDYPRPSLYAPNQFIDYLKHVGIKLGE